MAPSGTSAPVLRAELGSNDDDPLKSRDKVNEVRQPEKPRLGGGARALAAEATAPEEKNSPSGQLP